jgi:hypothetical protein
MTALNAAASSEHRVPAPHRRREPLRTLRMRLDCLPAAMRAARRWLLYKPGKVPYYANGQPRHGELDSPDDVASLATLDEALHALERDGRFAGLGFALGFDAALGAHWQGLDLDDALDGREFKTQRARELFGASEGYAEVSPSEKGLHVIGLGPCFRAVKWKQPGEQAIEAYSSGRYFTVTGRVMREGAPADLAPLVASIRADLIARGRAREHGARVTVGAAGDYLARQSEDLREWLEAHPIEEALRDAGYAQSGDRWLSPRSESGIPGVVILDRLRAVTFHASDAGIGTPTATGDGEVFNAFDVEARYRFGGDRKAAMREILASVAAQEPSGGANATGSGPEGGNAAPGAQEGSNQPARFRVLSAEELAALPALRWRVKGVLPAEGLAAVYGPPGSGKSFLALDLLGAVADGRDWFGYKVESCPVTYCALEGEHGISQRVAAYRIRHGSVPVRMQFVAQPFLLLQSKDMADLATAIRAAGGADGIVAVDTLNRATTGADENDSKDMGRIIASAQSLQRVLGGLVLLVHHSGKDASRGLRGHSSLHGALDAVIEVTREGSRREWKPPKVKDGPDGAAHSFRLDVVEVGFGDDPPTSCVVAPEEAPGDAVRRTRLPQGGNQRILWDALGDLLRASPDRGKAGAPSYRPCVRMEAVVEKSRGRLTCPPDRHSDRCRVALTGLVTRGLLALKEGWLWEP